MHKLTFLLLVITDVLLVFLAPLLLVPIALCFAKRTDDRTTHYGQDPGIQRYRLPRAFRFLETPDELLPGGMYEPTVLQIYNRLGWWLCSWYWLGLRNVGHGMWWRFGKSVPLHLKHMTLEQQKEYGVFSRERTFWKFRCVYGWKTVNDWYSLQTQRGILAVPRFTIRLNLQKN